METIFQKWLFAIKLQSWPKILVPWLLGLGLGLRYSKSLLPYEIAIYSVLTFLYSVFLTLFIVFLNDFADQDVDRIKRKMFPDGSQKTIPDQVLSSHSILKAGLISGIFSILLIGCLSYFTQSYVVFSVGSLSLLIFLFYSFPPLRLNYRGGGEILEGLGVGIVLPAFVLVVYRNPGTWEEIWQFFFGDGNKILGLGLLFGFHFFLALAGAIASGLSDEESDRKGGKKTVVTSFGNTKARKLIFILYGFSTVLLVLIPWNAMNRDWIIGIVFLVMLFYLNRMNRVSPKAVTNSFSYQKLFKKYLHEAKWVSIILLSVDLMII